MDNLLTQLNTLIANAEAAQADAEKWHAMLAMMQKKGFGPNITPEDIAYWIPDEYTMQEQLKRSWPPKAAPKKPAAAGRKLLTPEVRAHIISLKHQNQTPDEIAAIVGFNVTSVYRVLQEAQES